MVAVTQHARRLADILEQEGIGATITDNIAEPLAPGVMRVVAGSLPEGWVVGLNNLQELGAAPGGTPEGLYSLALLTDSELFGTVKERRYRRTRKAEGGPKSSCPTWFPAALSYTWTTGSPGSPASPVLGKI